MTCAACLLDLHIEILVIIQGYIDPSDIISLRKTCKYLQYASLERTVWLTALRQVCETHGIFKATFPLTDMSNRALEHAALSPSRFIAYMCKESPQPFVTRILQSRSFSDPTGTWKEGNFVDLMLVPGGRFLITKSTQGVIHLWDLGFASDTIIQPFPIASIVNQIPKAIKAMQPTTDGSGLRLILLEEPPTGPELQVYVIYPMETAPSFKVTVSLKLPTIQFNGFGFAQGILAFQLDNIAVVWDFVTDSIATWNAKTRYTDALVFDRIVILLGTEQFAMWKIPPLRPRLGSTDLLNLRPDQKYHRVPAFQCTYAFPNSNIRVPPVFWPQGFPRRPYFVVIADFDDPVKHRFDYYTIKPIDDDDMGGSVPFLMKASMATGPIARSNPIFWPAMRFGRWWQGDSCHGLHSASLSSRNTLNSPFLHQQQGTTTPALHELTPWENLQLFSA
ncbi:hypothetical protein Hypma_002159 [Hypsizygus marmoreus]|uniref:F-box domain-containing protein n=1 Tax=Hypsizygus marmoreus TaxID=39966 RepID=A0A369JZL1_HYPMA|nr:hypothetical protein Hypma_002159 [Hypsizygus marmoreus]